MHRAGSVSTCTHSPVHLPLHRVGTELKRGSGRYCNRKRSIHFKPRFDNRGKQLHHIAESGHILAEACQGRESPTDTQISQQLCSARHHLRHRSASQGRIFCGLLYSGRQRREVRNHLNIQCDAKHRLIQATKHLHRTRHLALQFVSQRHSLDLQ